MTEKAGADGGTSLEIAAEPIAQEGNGRETKRRPLDPQTRKRLGAQLRASYETVLNQPVPSRFAELIAKLDDETKPLVQD